MGNCLEQALLWHSLGVVPIPMMYKTKDRPLIRWTEWLNAEIEESTIRKWFFPELLNMAIACGGSTNLVIIDFDTADGFETWQAGLDRNSDWFEVSCRGYRVQSGRGHHLYVYSDKKIGSWKLPKRAIDIRANGNYALAVPSVHPSGAVYKSYGSPLTDIYLVSDIETMFVREEDEKSGCAYVPQPKSNFDAIESKLPATFRTPADLRQRYPILQYVSKFSEVRRKSSDNRWWYSRCINPLHVDMHPSFQIDTVTNRVKCLSPSCALYSTMGLDIIDCYMRLNNVDFKTAINSLYEEIGVYDNVLQNI